MSGQRRINVTGIGVGLAAAGVTAAVGVVADRLSRSLKTAKALESLKSLDTYEEKPTAEIVVIAGDGVALHVEMDEPEHPPAGLPKGQAIPTVVLCHGYTLSLRSWVFQRRALKAAGYRVLLWDQRGHGQSRAGTKESYDIDQLGHDLGDVISQVAPEGPLILVGRRAGGE